MFVPLCLTLPYNFQRTHYSLISNNQTGVILSPVEKIVIFFLEMLIYTYISVYTLKFLKFINFKNKYMSKSTRHYKGYIGCCCIS